MPEEQNNLENQNQMSPTWNKHLWLYVAILVLLGIGGVAWGIYDKKFKSDAGIIYGQDAKEICGPQPPVECADKTRLGCRIIDQKWECYPVSTLDDFSGWQTYRNDVYGFEVKYPQEYTFWENNYSSSKEWMQVFLALSSGSESIEIYAEENEGHCLEVLCDSIPVSQVIFNSITWDYLGSTRYDDAGASSTRPAVYRYVRGKTTFYLTFNSQEEAAEILSTFKFIE